MPTIYQKVNNLLTAANATTGESDINLTDAVATLIDGYGSGGGVTEPYIEETYDSNGNLTSAIMHGYTTVRDRAFYECSNLALASLPNGITKVGANAFRNCQSLTSISLLNVTELGHSAFSGCTSLASIIWPQGIRKLGQYVFASCNAITTVSLNVEHLSECYDSVFYYCNNLTTVTFEGTPTSLNNRMFVSCSNLTTINVAWAENAVYGAPWGATNATINYNYTGA